MRLHVVVDFDEIDKRVMNRDAEVARIHRQLADRLAHPDVGAESVNCTPLHDIRGNHVGDVWLASDDDSDAKLLRDMARHMYAFEEAAGPDNFGDEAENAGGRLSRAVGLYLSAIGHPEAPDWANRTRGGKK